MRLRLKTTVEPKYHILYKDKLLRKERSEDCAPYTFDSEEEAENFILDHRAANLDHYIVSTRGDYFVFITQTDLGTVQGM